MRTKTATAITRTLCASSKSETNPVLDRVKSNRIIRVLALCAGFAAASLGALSPPAFAQWAVRDEFPNGKLRGERYEHFTKEQWEASNFAPPEAMQAWQDRRYGMFIHFGITSKAEQGFVVGQHQPALCAGFAEHHGQRAKAHGGMDHLAQGHEAGEVQRQGMGRHRPARGLPIHRGLHQAP